jgi:DNA polymerase-3 subunit gamma/tau
MANESRHMDIIEMDAASNRGIDDIKELIEHTKYKPSTGRHKIFIIDEVHMLTTQAFNALLKTLEEPPDFVKFILATTDPLKLPPTILSRTQHFRFKKIPQKLTVSHLQHILELENIEYDKEALEIISRSGAGSLRDSLTLLDQAIVYSKNHVDVETVTNMLGIIQPALLDQLLDDISSKDESKILTFISKSTEYEAEMIIDELTLHLKELLFGKDSRFSPMVIDRFFRILADAKGLLALGSDGEFVLSLTLLKMIEALSVRDIDSMINTLQKELSGVKTSNTYATRKSVNIQTPVQTDIQTDDESVQTAEVQEPPAPKIQPDTSFTQATSTQPADMPAPTDKEPSTGIEAVDIRFANLIQKLYDRDYDLGSCFERNITFENFADDTLTWLSSAEGEDKKILVNAWGIIKMFVHEIFGFETKIKNIPAESKKKTDPVANIPTQPSRPEPAHQNEFAQSSSTIESLEIPSSCTNPDIGTTEASREKDPSTLLEEPMIKEMIDLFDPKKVRIVRKS